MEGFLQAAFKVAGFEIKPPFKRMTYDEAIRQYGIDKPDLRLPKLTNVREAFTAEQLQTLQLNPELPVVAIRIPKIGELRAKSGMRTVHCLASAKKRAWWMTSSVWKNLFRRP